MWGREESERQRGGEEGREGGERMLNASGFIQWIALWRCEREGRRDGGEGKRGGMLNGLYIYIYIYIYI